MHNKEHAYTSTGIKKTKRILGISSSPRESGSRSEQLLVKLLDHAKEFGAEVELIRLKDKNLYPCTACYSNKPALCDFPCTHKDQGDTQLVLEKIIEADALVVATPVHWGGPSPLLSILLGKMTAIENNQDEIWDKSGKEPLAGKPFALIASQDGDGAAMALSQVQWALNHMGLFCIPYGMIFEPSILKRSVARMGLRLIGERRFEWIENTIRLAARNLILMSDELADCEFDDKLFREPRS
ncbi:MAG: NAD(P)H-dependent oxidoreductase [bacterium]|nr:NAD(P)H-dependent oxidoreductase [bacterium]